MMHDSANSHLVAVVIILAAAQLHLSQRLQLQQLPVLAALLQIIGQVKVTVARLGVAVDDGG